MKKSLKTNPELIMILQSPNKKINIVITILPHIFINIIFEKKSTLVDRNSKLAFPEENISKLKI